MATDSNTLLNEAKCLGCASNASMADMLKLGLWSRIAAGEAHVTTEWSQQVVDNGGPEPSQNTIIAVQDFTDALEAAGLTGKIISLCVFVPDSLIAATTPIIRTQGFTPWTNNGFVDADLTVEGLKGDGVAKYLDTGVQANSGGAFNAGTGNCGLSEIITETEGNTDNVDMGHLDAVPRALILSGSTTINTIAGRTAFFSASATLLTSIAWTTDWNRSGYVSGNNLSGTASIYTASPLVSHSLLTSVAVASIPSVTNETLFAFANNSSGVAVQHCGKRISVMCIHDAWTAGESATFASLLFTLRTSLGGGTGDPIVNWAARVVTLGGVAPSANTQTALRTFYSGLVSNSLLSKFVALNPYVPDNLTAARTMLVWNGGLEIWTNTNFVAGDLTVNGLTGNLTNKDLLTGIIPSTVAAISPNITGFSTTSAGITLMISNIPASANLYDFGVAGPLANTQFALINNAGNIFFYCWKFINNGSDFVTFAAPAPGATWTGYLSGNRTASNAIACYRASTALAHAAGATGAGAQTGAAIGTNTARAHALGGAGISSWSNHTVSFLAIHSGLTEAQSLALYNLVAALRTSLGGGNP